MTTTNALQVVESGGQKDARETVEATPLSEADTPAPLNHVASGKFEKINAYWKDNKDNVANPFVFTKQMNAFSKGKQCDGVDLFENHKRYEELLEQHTETAARTGADGYWKGDAEEDSAVEVVLNFDKDQAEKDAFQALANSAQQVWDNSNATDTTYDRNTFCDSQKFVTAISMLTAKGEEKMAAQISRMTTFVAELDRVHTDRKVVEVANLLASGIAYAATRYVLVPQALPRQLRQLGPSRGYALPFLAPAEYRVSTSKRRSIRDILGSMLCSRCFIEDTTFGVKDMCVLKDGECRMHVPCTDQNPTGVSVVPAWIVLSDNVQPEASDHHYVCIKPAWVDGDVGNKKLRALFHDGMKTNPFDVKGGWCDLSTVVEDMWVLNVVVWMPLAGFEEYAVKAPPNVHDVTVVRWRPNTCPIDCHVAGMSYFDWKTFMIKTGTMLCTGLLPYVMLCATVY